MEHNPNNSRIGVQFGKPLEDNEKASVRAVVNFGKAAADLQTEKVKSLIGAEDPNLSLVVVFTPAPGKNVQLEEHLKSLFDGKEEGAFAADISNLFRGGLVSYTVLHSGANLVLHIKAGPTTADMVSQMLGMVLGFGTEEIASTEQAALNVNLLSGIDFNDLLKLHDQDFTTICAFFTSFLAEITLKSVAGSQLDKKLIEILKQIIPNIQDTPLPLLALMQTVDVDIAFNSTEELPPKLRKEFIDDNDLKQFPRVPKDLKESPECKLFERFVEVLTSHIEVYATVDKVAAIHVDINTPGFGVALTTPKQDTLNPAADLANYGGI